MLTRQQTMRRGVLKPAPEPPQAEHASPKCDASAAARHIRCKLHKQTTHSAEEIEHIMRELTSIRSKLRTRTPRFNYQIQLMVFSFYGFGNVLMRNNLMWCLRYAINPKLLYCSQTKRNFWEAVIVFPVRVGTLQNFFSSECKSSFRADGTLGSPVLLSPVDAVAQTFSSLIDLFRLSADVIDLNSWADPATTSCVQRIESGNYHFGDLWHDRNRWLTVTYQQNLRRHEDAERNRTVRQITGNDFTVGNMLATYHELRNLEIDVNRERAMVAQALQILPFVTTNLARQAALMHLIISASQQTLNPNATQTSSTNSHNTQARRVSINAPLREPPPSQLPLPDSLANLPTNQASNQQTNQPTNQRTTGAEMPPHHFLPNINMYQDNIMANLERIRANLSSIPAPPPTNPHFVNLVTPSASPSLTPSPAPRRSEPPTSFYVPATPPPQFPENNPINNAINNSTDNASNASNPIIPSARPVMVIQTPGPEQGYTSILLRRQAARNRLTVRAVLHRPA